MWPPAVVDNKITLRVVRKALTDFDRAKEEDEITRRLYEQVKEKGVFENYFRINGGKGGFNQYNERYQYNERHKNNRDTRAKLPQMVQKANNSLRKAANHLSLAFFEDNRLLFLGDLESFEISKVVADLASKGRKNFYILVTPHHGTHWYKSLNEINCVFSVTSNGDKLYPKIKPNFKEISERSFATHVNGDILIPDYPRRRFWPGFSWCFDEGLSLLCLPKPYLLQIP